MSSQYLSNMKPLANVLRPTRLEDVVGQRKLVSEGSLLRQLIENDTISSAIFYGPPGTGKTTIAEIIASHTNSRFSKLNATSATVSMIRKEAKTAKIAGSPLLLFVDECHRFSKTQQDVLLPYIECGDIIFVGATTENPMHSLTNALVSRSHIFQFEPISDIDLVTLIKRCKDHYGDVKIEKEAIKHIIRISCGDGRKVISTFEMAYNVSGGNITEEIVKTIAPNKYAVFSRDGDEHYDLASAFQGSIQASDADSAIYWLAKWLESGEDPRYIARRLLVSASEDAAGNPEAVSVAHAAYTAAKEIGRPECDILLAHATILTATAPRDKMAAKAIWEAVKDVKYGKTVAVPKEMKDAHYLGAKKLGNGAYKDGGNQQAYVGVNKIYVRRRKK